MATLRQKKVAKALIENLQTDKPKSAGEVLKSVGYGTGLQNQPKRVLESEGVKEELSSMGFDEETAKRVVGEILQNADEDRDRLKAAELVFKVYGSFAPDKSINLNVEAKQSPHVTELTKKLNELYKGNVDQDPSTGA